MFRTYSTSSVPNNLVRPGNRNSRLPWVERRIIRLACSTVLRCCGCTRLIQRSRDPFSTRKGGHIDNNGPTGWRSGWEENQHDRIPSPRLDTLGRVIGDGCQWIRGCAAWQPHTCFVRFHHLDASNEGSSRRTGDIFGSDHFVSSGWQAWCRLELSICRRCKC